MSIKHANHTRVIWWVVLLLPVVSIILSSIVACSPGALTPVKEDEMALSLISSAFREGEEIPVEHTCDGEDISPPLEWSEPPPGTRALALIMEDPDAPIGVFTHWVIFNIPADSRRLTEAIPTQAQLSNGTLQGKNNFREIGYRGPCPPTGRPHRYQFTLYALAQPLDLTSGASKKQVIDNMTGHLLAQGRLMGKYQR